MAVLWTAGVNTGRLTPNEFVAVTSANSARILNIYPQKGVISLGADADIAIWDPKGTKTISAKSQDSRMDYNVFEGYKVQRSASQRSMRRGRLAPDGELRAEKGEGRYIRAPAFGFPGQRLWKTNTAPKAVAR